ncbi:MAG: deoxyribose-phosphate aldolase [Flavobacteriaceae bacterium]|nr:deoxyribose-phosphate aldolase [Flavobacteriaceae bacterium]
MRILFYSFIISISLFACKQKVTDENIAETILNRSIEVSGGDVIDNSTISFNFRDRHYKAERNSGLYKLERNSIDSTRTILDQISNKGFQRFVNDELQTIPDSMVVRYSNSVNSVHYFSVLPYGLDDPAVNAEYLGLKVLKGKEYHKIKVTFDEIGGGDDFEDIFIYWISKDDHKLDYLAYEFHVNGGGIRFREAFNERYINGIRFVDYNNLKPMDKKSNLLEIDFLFEENILELVSKIELKNLTVE